jgi:cytochrome P450
MIEFNPYSRSFAEDPYPIYAQLRDEAPVFYQEELNFYALSLYEDVVKAHRDAATFSSSGGVTIEGNEAKMPLLIVKDQPEHGWAKSLVTKLFSRTRMEALDVFIRQRTIELLDEAYEKHGPDGEFNFVNEFSVRLPLDVISELLGIPEEYRAEIHHLSNQTVLRGEDADPSQTAHTAMRMLQIYMTLAADRRANPRDDVINMLINERVTDENGIEHSMSDHEIAVRFLEMGFAGHETVAKAIPNGAMALHRFPDERRKISENPELLRQAVEEFLRYDPPSHLQGRTTLTEVTLHDVTIPARSKVMLLTGSAVRDPRAFANPDTLDVSRDLDSKSIYFGFGVHKCLGIHLARQEQKIAWEEILKRFPDYEVDPARTTRSILSNVRGVSGLPIILGARSGH